MFFNKFKVFLPVFVLLLTGGLGCISFSGQSQGAIGMFKSENKGDTWSTAVAYPTAQGVKSLSTLKVYRMYRDPGDYNAWYLGTRGQGLYYSYDNGATWQFVSVLSGKYIYGLAVDPKDKCTIYLTDGPHIYKTDDCLRTWRLVFTEERASERFVDLAVDWLNPKIVYGAQLNGDILRSSDSGASWRIIKRFGVGVRTLTIDPSVTSKTRLYVATYKDGLYRSDDGGDQWTDLSAGFSGFNESKTFNRLVLNPSKKDSLFWVSKYGILRSDDAGLNWKDLKLLTPPGGVNIYSFAVSPKSDSELYYTGTLLDNKKKNLKSTFYRSSDGGVNWVTKQLPSNTIPVVMEIHNQNTGMILLGFTDLGESTSSGSANTSQFGI